MKAINDKKKAEEKSKKAVAKGKTVKKPKKLVGGAELDEIEKIITLFIYFQNIKDNNDDSYRDTVNELVKLLSVIQEIKVKIDSDIILNNEVRKNNIVYSFTIPDYKNIIYDAFNKYIKDIYIIIATRYPNNLNIYKTNVKYGKLYSELYKGQELYEGGHLYEGILVKGKKNGKGIMIYATQATGNGDVYDGDFKDDKKEGNGKMTYANGDIYDGDFKDDKKEGKGKMTYANGDVYDGVFKDDKKEGNGKMNFKNGKRFIIDMSKKSTFYKENTGYPDDIYEGNWKEDKMNGKGKFTKSEGPGIYITYKGRTLISSRNKWTFEGIFVKNMATYGTLIDGESLFENRQFIQTDILTLEEPPEVIPVTTRIINSIGTNKNPRFDEYLKRRNETDERIKQINAEEEARKHLQIDNVRNRDTQITSDNSSPFSTLGV
jgi:hypothetical protein